MIGSTLGLYRVVAPLGRGGMSEVYLARDESLDGLAKLVEQPTRP